MLTFICLYIIGHYVIQPIYLPMSSRLYILFTVDIARYGGFGIGLVSGRVADRILALPRSLSLGLIDLLDFTAWYGLIGGAIKHFFYFSRSFRYSFHLCSYSLYCFTALSLISMGPPSPSLIYFWSERLPKHSSELCNIYFCTGSTALFKSTQ